MVYDSIHVVWAQGWWNPPDKVLHNVKRWAEVGTVVPWSIERAIERGLVEAEFLADAKSYAMAADIILANAQLVFGGMAVGADMVPLRPELLKARLAEWSQRKTRPLAGRGCVVYESHRDLPYNGASWFPPGHPWIERVVKMQRENVLGKGMGADEDVSAVTGPRAWRALIDKERKCWNASVEVVPGAEAFLYEPMEKWRRTEGAWIDPGLYGDWKGEKPEKWTGE